MLVVAILIVAATSLLAWTWVRGIDNMNNNHPNYKGKDFLNWDKDEIEEDMKEFREWDSTLMDGLEYEDDWDNKHHNEDV